MNTISGSSSLLRNIDVGEMIRLREQLAESDRRVRELQAEVGQRDSMISLLHTKRVEVTKALSPEAR